MELVGQSVDRAARAGHHHRALPGEHLADARADAPHTAGDQHDAAPEIEIHRAVAAHQSKCLLRSAMTISSATVEPGIVAVTVDYPR